MHRAGDPADARHERRPGRRRARREVGLSVRYAIAGDGARIAWEERGDGDPVVFVHGLAYDRHGWGPLPGILAKEFRVVLVDNRGVGDSDTPEGPYTVAQMAEDVVAVVREAGIGTAHLIGVSLGGFIAQEVALGHPDRIRKLVLLSTSPGGPNAYPMPRRGVEAFGRFPTMERSAGLRLMVENSLGDHGVRERPELVDEIYAYRLERAPSVAAWAAQLAASTAFDALERIHRIAAPTLVVHGGEDTVIDSRNGDLLAERIPGARIERIPGRGHLVMWEEAAFVAQIVQEFLHG